MSAQPMRMSLLPPDTPETSLNDAQRHAIAEAMRGNWGPADRMELDYLNNLANGIAPHRADADSDDLKEELGIKEAMSFKAIALHRGCAPGNAIEVQWQVSTPCDDCDGEGKLVVSGGRTTSIECPSCEGDGWAECLGADIFTDIDGIFLEAR